MYKGIGASAGIGIGKIVKIKEEELNYTKQSIEDTEAEKKRLSDAIEVFIEKTQKMVESRIQRSQNRSKLRSMERRSTQKLL